MSRRALGVAAIVLAADALAACRETPAPEPSARPDASADPLGDLVAAHRARLSVAAVAPTSAPSAPAPREPLRVLIGGDLIPHRPSLVAPSAIGASLAPLGPLLRSADIAIANYETATAYAEGHLPKRKMDFAAPPEWLGALRVAGLGAVSVANNHACDLDVPGVEATLAAAHESGVATLGGDAEDPWAPRVLVDKGGKRVCAVAWTSLMNAEGACARTRRLAVALPGRAGRARVAAAITRSRAACDATVAILHDGREYARQTEGVMATARHVAELGADAVVIHHPHVVSPVELHTTRDHRRVPLFASVGNLVSNQGESWTPAMFPVLPENRRLVCVNAWTRLGLLADLAFTFEERTVRLDWGFHAVWTDNEHARERAVAVPRITARLLDPEADRAIVAKLSEDRKGPVRVFGDPCWLEGPASPEARRLRCSVTSTKAITGPAPAAVAVARPRRRR